MPRAKKEETVSDKDKISALKKTPHLRGRKPAAAGASLAGVQKDASAKKAKIRETIKPAPAVPGIKEAPVRPRKAAMKTREKKAAAGASLAGVQKAVSAGQAQGLPLPDVQKTAPEQAPAGPTGRQMALPAVRKDASAPAQPEVVSREPKPAPAGPQTPLPVPPAAVETASRDIELELPITVKDLSVKLQEKPSVIIKKLMNLKIMAGINHVLDEAAARIICGQYKCIIRKAPSAEEIALRSHEHTDNAEDLALRPPIVTFMGHVDHGKTSLLDAIRKTKVVETEHGGITQHIGAYCVRLSHGDITFLDTPGHEAFTAMRARGARVTDIVVLVVAADDGIMPQTEEAIDHARAAGVPIIVALNKIDKPQANSDIVKKQMGKLDLTPEEWGGKTITVPVSAKTGQGIDDLLEMILLEAQMLELKGNPLRPARGIVLEAKMSKGKGPTATLLVQNGTLRLNEHIVVGHFYGKIRAMFNDRLQSVTAAAPSAPVEVLGITGIPDAGEQFFVLADEKQAKDLAAMRLEKERQEQMRPFKHVSLEDLHAQIAQGKLKELKIIIKADVQGSLEAIKETLSKLDVSEIKFTIIHTGIGGINSSDVILAVASDALIVGFNVTADDRARELVAKEGIDVKTYNIIYELANEIKAAVEGMLEPKLKKVFLGRAEARKVFKLTKTANVAGCYVTKGAINRNAVINVVRNGAVAFEGKLSSLKRFKDDVRDVAEGFECGINIAGFDLMEGDVIEAYQIEKIARKL